MTAPYLTGHRRLTALVAVSLAGGLLTSPVALAGSAPAAASGGSGLAAAPAGGPTGGAR